MREQIQHKIDFKTKPLQSLGILEEIALKIALIQQTISPVLESPTIVVFAGDHGITKEGVSAYPQEVTYQMVLNFLNGGAAINVFARQNGIELKIVDAGVNFDFMNVEGLISNKVAKGTKSFLTNSAMTSAETSSAIQLGRNLIADIIQKGCNVVGFGEMGIGNTSSASMLMHYVSKIPLADCVGRGTGLNDIQLANKIQILQKAKDFHGEIENGLEILTAFGGFEIAQMVGAFLQAFEDKVLILVDGFIASSAFIIAQMLAPEIINYALFCHLSNESGHKKMLDFLNAKPILSIGMRLGEGSGCAVVYPLIESSLAFLNEMASFESAQVSTKEK